MTYCTTRVWRLSSAGYLVGDLFDTDFKRNKADVCHHVMGCVLGGGVIALSLSIKMQVMHISNSFARMEISTVFLNLMWFAREFSAEDVAKRRQKQRPDAAAPAPSASPAAAKPFKFAGCRRLRAMP